MKNEVPIWEKSNLTLEEAAAYSGIGINKLRKLTDREDCRFVLWNGSKRLIKRKGLDEYTEKMYSIWGEINKVLFSGRKGTSQKGDDLLW